MTPWVIKIFIFVVGWNVVEPILGSVICHVIFIMKCPWDTFLSPSGPRFNIKMTSYWYRKSHCGDKTILRPSYLHNGISYTGKTTSLYWIGALGTPLTHLSPHHTPPPPPPTHAPSPPPTPIPHSRTKWPLFHWGLWFVRKGPIDN